MLTFSNGQIVDFLKEFAKNVPRYEDGFLYPPHGPGIGCELNEEMVEKLMTPGRSPTVIGK